MSGGVPVVLLPGMNCSARLWTDVAERLQIRGHEVLIAALENDSLDRCVAGLRTRLPDRFALAGLSLGGIVAMALTRQAPHRVTRLCLADTNPRAPTSEQHRSWDRQLARLAAGASARDIQQEVLPVLLSPSASVELRSVTLAMADEVGATRLAGQLRLQGTRIDERPALRRVGVPTLVLAGADDALCPVARHQEIHALVPHSRLVVLADTGHLTPLERPAEVAAAMHSWLG